MMHDVAVLFRSVEEAAVAVRRLDRCDATCCATRSGVDLPWVKPISLAAHGGFLASGRVVQTRTGLFEPVSIPEREFRQERVHRPEPGGILATLADFRAAGTALFRVFGSEGAESQRLFRSHAIMRRYAERWLSSSGARRIRWAMVLAGRPGWGLRVGRNYSAISNLAPSRSWLFVRVACRTSTAVLTL
jgi:hypothetical protein